MGNDKPGKQFLNFINANKRKHDNYELDEVGKNLFNKQLIDKYVAS